MIKCGKPCGPLLRHKQVFFKENDAKLAEFRRLAEVYAAQPRRMHCKNCAYLLGEPSFQKLGVEYIFCSRCGHLNGAHEDTEAFCAALYTEGGGKSYGTIYASESSAAYGQRVEDIYLPKARFLTEVLEEQGEDPPELTFADLGAGSGYFVAALLAVGMTNVTGFEVSESQVKLANTMLGRELIIRHDLSETVDIASTVNADVVSLIGVLEHVQNPRDMLQALTGNRNVSYIFLSLPLFSPCVFFEMVFPGVMPRQLVGGHTHLYSESSIDYFYREFNLKRVGEWWFGTDLMDLYRSILITLEKSGINSIMLDTWEETFKPAIDDMQLALDKRRLSSEVHMVLKIKR